jgi:hypothetical protein
LLLEANVASPHDRIDDTARAKPRDWSAELRALYGQQQARAIAAAKAAEAKRVSGTKPSLPIARYVGVYTDSLYGETTVTAAGSGLRVRIGSLEGTLEHWQYDTFRIRWDRRWLGTPLLTFVLDASGTPSRVQIDRRSFARTDRGW